MAIHEVCLGVQVLDILQKVFYRSNPAREAFVEMCADDYVQKMTFDRWVGPQHRQCIITCAQKEYVLT